MGVGKRFIKLIKKKIRPVYEQKTNIMPRGLINLNNRCFANSVYQALLSCTEFNYLLSCLLSLENVWTDRLKNKFHFITEFTHYYKENLLISNTHHSKKKQPDVRDVHNKTIVEKNMPSDSKISV